MSNIADFDESRPEFEGFNAHYNDTIAPYLDGRESERKKAVKQARLIGLGLITTGFGVAATFYLKGFDTIFVIIPAIAGLILGIAGMLAWAEMIGDEIKLFVMKNICEFIGWEYQVKEFVAPNLQDWQTNRLLPKSIDRFGFEDQMKGNAHGADFEFCEAHLEKRSRDKDGNDSWSTVFRGIMLRIDFHRKFLGRTVVLRDAGFFNSKKKSGMKRVGLVDPVFEKIFEAYGTDQVEARYLLTPEFMQTLVDLEKTVSGKKVRFGFFNDKLHIAIEAPNQFEVGSMFKTLIGTAKTKKILNEINAIFEVVDSVAKPKRSR